jgi:hypothetical protein
MRPAEVLTIIHDKMDHAKIACPCYAKKIKATDDLLKLQVAVTDLYEIHKYVLKLFLILVYVFPK